jgi:hypothetical protein
VPMNPPTTPISVAGGTYPASIWQKYMKVAKKGCGDFSKPDQAFQTKPFKGKYQQVQPEPKDQVEGGDSGRKKDTDKKPDGKGNGGGADNGGAAPQGGAQPTQPQAPAAQPQPAQPTPAQPAQPAPQAPAQGGAPVDPAQYVAPG